MAGDSDLSREQDMGWAHTESLVTSCSLPEESLDETSGNFQQNELPSLPSAFPDPHPFSSTVTSGTDFDKTPSLAPFLETPTEIGPYGVFWPSQTLGLGSVGQFLTFSAQDGSQKNLEYLPLAPRGIDSWNVGFDSAPLDLPRFEPTLPNEDSESVAPHFDFTPNHGLSAASNASSLQYSFPGGSGLVAESSDVYLTSNIDDVQQSSTEFLATKSLQCQICSRSFSKHHLLNRHITTHSKPYQCQKCPRSFSSNKDLRRHMAAIHAEASSELYYCNVSGCKYERQSLGRGNAFRRRDNLRRHMRNAHDHNPS